MGLVRVWGILCAVLVLAGCGGGGGAGPVTSASIEETVRPELEKRLAGLTDGPATSIDSLDCVKKNDTEASCVAVYSDTSGGSATSRISVDIDPETGDVLWQQELVNASP